VSGSGVMTGVVLIFVDVFFSSDVLHKPFEGFPSKITTSSTSSPRYLVPRSSPVPRNGNLRRRNPLSICLAG